MVEQTNLRRNSELHKLYKKDSQNDIENMNNENEEKKENKIEPKVIKFVIN